MPSREICSLRHGLAWYCANSQNQTHPVKQKQPNAWGLFDALGNVVELTTSLNQGSGYGPSPQVDRDATFPTYSKFNEYEKRGGLAMWTAAVARAAQRSLSSGPEDIGGPNQGFRLVRTRMPAAAGGADR